MKAYIKNIILAIATLALFQGCAIDEAIAKNYRANVKYEKEHGTQIDQNRQNAKYNFKKAKVEELINAYGQKRGYLIAQKALTDDNIQYTFDSQNFHAFIDNEVLIKYIDETRGLEDDNNNNDTIIIIRKDN